MISLRKLPIAFRALFSSFLALIGLGYLTALSLLFLVDIEPHQKAGQSLVQDISQTYHGLPSNTRLEAALRGPMATMASSVDRTRVIKWIHDGASSEGYADVAPVFQNNCITCHSPQSGLPIPPLTSYDNIKKLLQTDTGENIVELARVSHIHLFGISLIFMFTGAIFALSETPVWLRVALVVFPYLTIIVDIGSWWLTKYFEPAFAYTVIIGGAGMGLALAAQIFISLWEMWIDTITGLRHLGRHERAHGESQAASGELEARARGGAGR
ncbi:MAG: hypothetical protein ACLQME_01500 [Alphaproteobacteria bacterium]